MNISLSLSLILICVIVFPIIHAIPKDAEMTESKNANLSEHNDSEGSGKKDKKASADDGNEAEEKTGQNSFQYFPFLFYLSPVRFNMHRTLLMVEKVKIKNALRKLTGRTTDTKNNYNNKHNSQGERNIIRSFITFYRGEQ